LADRKDHYSYTVYAERETAESFEAQRFSGPVGTYLREQQERQLADWLGDPSGSSVLDVGAGTGRVAVPLASAGARVCAVDASEAMLEVARRNAESAGVQIDFRQHDAMELPFDDQSFDSVISMRVLMHVVDWRQALSEICRCAGDRLIFDFPPRLSIAALQAPVRALIALFRPKTQRFRLFSLRRIRKELRRHGFEIERVDRLFVLPIMLHKALHIFRLTLAFERLLALLGLRRLFGAPVTILARRRRNPEGGDVR
jgi:ubiquinone/menaquinone biosynthesis C-methylase UbiE